MEVSMAKAGIGEQGLRMGRFPGRYRGGKDGDFKFGAEI
jgi:hypothetical protein